MSASATLRTRSRSSTRFGKLLRAIGRPGGRRLIGPWQQDGMAFIAGIAVDTAGTLWVTEADASPKRVSAWDAKTGKFVREFFGSTAYGALGGAINPLDPCLMVGHGCEWRIDPLTGRAACLGCFVRSGMSNSRFGIGGNGRLYLAVTSGWAYDTADVKIFERIGDVDYKLRSSFEYQGKDKDKKTLYWVDENGDGRKQPNEVTTIDRPRAVQWLVHELRARSDDLRRRPPVQGCRLHALRGAEIRLAESDADAGPRHGLGRWPSRAGPRRIRRIGKLVSLLRHRQRQRALELSGQLRRRARLAPGMPAGRWA